MLNTGPLRIGGRKQLLAEDVFRYIGKAILDGEFKPRQRIRDADLALRLHVSRMPVREALQRLERIGLVRIYPSRYTEVSEVTAATFEASRVFAGFQSGFVAHLAAARMDGEHRAEAAALIDELVAAIDDSERSSLLRRDLFTFLSREADNFLQHSLLDEASLALTYNLQGRTLNEEQRAASLAACADLRLALMERNASGAEAAARALHGLA